MIDIYGKKLIFLISQPRAGSTLLQRILGSHSNIHTASEPWIMLNPFYALRSDGYETDFNASWAHSAINEYIKSLPNGEGDYYEGVRRMYSYLYGKSLKPSQKHFFLDKTPRYYNIIPELYKTFPKAKFIILLRNPLACLSSILKTWVKENWYYLYYYKQDLTVAPDLLIKGIKYLGDNAIVVKYEDIISTTDKEIKQLCDYIGIEFEPEMVDYGNQNLPIWHFGDKESVYKHSKASVKNINKWSNSFDNPQAWRLSSDYLRTLGKATVHKMGYSYEHLKDQVDNKTPSNSLKLLTFSFSSLTCKNYSNRTSLEKRFLKIVELFRKGIISIQKRQ